MYTIYETFVGAGGSHLGFKKHEFESRYVNDFCHEALQTLLDNNPEIKKAVEEKRAIADETSIVDVDPKKILRDTHMKPKELDVLFGGIVCKGFSLAGERSPNDERNYFYHKQLEIVEVVKPKVSIIENVPGIQTAEVLAPNVPQHIADKVDEVWQELENYKGEKANLRKLNKITKEFENKGKLLRKQKEELLKEIKDNGYLISVYDDILDLYNKLGYTVYKNVVNSACYGAATKRERVIIIAIRNDVVKKLAKKTGKKEEIFVFPEALCADENLRKKYPYLYVDGHNYEKVKTVNDALSEIDYSDLSDIDNIPMQHAEKTVERFKYIPEGDNIANHIDELPDELKISRFYSRGNTMRLNGDDASPTLVPGHSNFPIHPKEHRSITVREAATITGFPTDYKFVGSHTKRCEEVGNAVPPPLSTAIAGKVKELLDEYYSD